MRRLACVCSFALVVAIPAIRTEGKPPPQIELTPLPAGLGDENYKAPKADGVVVELLDEGVDALFPVLSNDGGGEAGTAAREDRDVFAGVEAVRVTPMQKHRSKVPGWNFKIVEAPKNAGEYRFLRFAWKKSGGSGLMIQFHDPAKSWAMRFHAATNVFGWAPSTQVSDKLSAEWEVHTRDLFKEFGAFNITGMALSPLDGTYGLFDHILLGRTVADLDKATDAALGRIKPAKAMEKAERDAAWENLLGADRVKAATALRSFLASAPDQVAFVEERLAKTAIDKDQLAQVRKLVADLDADSFDVRDAATDALVKLGASAAEAVRAALSAAASDEVRYRARLILRKLDGGNAPVSQTGRLSRVVRVLERADTAKARDLLTRLADGDYGFEITPDAKAALARMKK